MCHSHVVLSHCSYFPPNACDSDYLRYSIALVSLFFTALQGNKMKSLFIIAFVLGILSPTAAGKNDLKTIFVK